MTNSAAPLRNGREIDAKGNVKALNEDNQHLWLPPDVYLHMKEKIPKTENYCFALLWLRSI